jgi:hypothetical protein
MMTEPRLLRQRAENQVIMQIQRRENGGRAQLVVDQQHAFFFDHPHDHIPGLLLLEGAHQIAQRLLPGEKAWFATGLQARFTKYCLFDGPIKLDASMKLQAGKWCSEVSVSQHRVPRATICWQFVGLPPGLLRQPPGVNSCEAVDKSRVNKHRVENVMIAQPYPLPQGGVECHALAPHRDNLLADSDGQAHPLALLETFMQLQRFLNGTESTRLRDVLLGVSMSQSLPLQAGSTFSIRTDAEEEKEAGKYFSRGADLWAAGRCFARCDIHTHRSLRAKAKSLQLKKGSEV